MGFWGFVRGRKVVVWVFLGLGGSWFVGILRS